MKVSTVTTIISLIFMMTTQTYSQQIHDYTENPFGLVYDGAITGNTPGEVNIHQVNYNLDGNMIAANVYTPAGFDPSGSMRLLSCRILTEVSKSRLPDCMHSGLPGLDM